MKLVVEHRTGYGREWFEPINKKAKDLVKLMSRKNSTQIRSTFTKKDIKALMEIGFKIEIKTPKVEL